jgi:hypothetical protein
MQGRLKTTTNLVFEPELIVRESALDKSLIRKHEK